MATVAPLTLLAAVQFAVSSSSCDPSRLNSNGKSHCGARLTAGQSGRDAWATRILSRASSTRLMQMMRRLAPEITYAERGSAAGAPSVAGALFSACFSRAFINNKRATRFKRIELARRRLPWPIALVARHLSGSGTRDRSSHGPTLRLSRSDWHLTRVRHDGARGPTLPAIICRDAPFDDFSKQVLPFSAVRRGLARKNASRKCRQLISSRRLA